MKKKSQIQIGETVAVLFVFFILIVVGLIFYVKVIKGNLSSEKEEISQLKSVGIDQRVMFLPEIQCSKDAVKEESSCIDILKLESAPGIIKENELYYYDLLEFSDINVFEVYPMRNKQWNLYSRKNENLENKFVTNVPISLYDPAARRKSFGILRVETFSAK